MKQGKQGIYARYIKRILDVLLSGCALVVLSPVLLIVAVLVRTKLGSPVIFCQERPGKDEKVFKMYKFRSMTDARDENGELLPDEVRLTKFGRALRSTSLEYLPLYNEEQHHRHDVTPGLTGLAQVHGRFNLLWQEKFAYDIEYVNHISFRNDLSIVLQTVREIFRKEDTENPELGTWYPFLGNDVEDQQITLKRTKDEKEIMH